MKIIRFKLHLSTKGTFANINQEHITSIIDYGDYTEITVIGGNIHRIIATEKEVFEALLGCKKRKATGLGYIIF